MAIKITDKTNDKEYILEYTRDTIRSMERQGFRVNEVTEMPASMIPMLFYGAFFSNHPTMKRKKADELYYSLSNRSELINKLLEMYGEAYSSLTDDSENSGNAEWEEVS